MKFGYRTRDTAPRLSAARLVSALHRHCAIRVFLGPLSQCSSPNSAEFYVVRFSSGIVKVGVSRSFPLRLAGLPREATLRFPGLDVSDYTVTPIAVVAEKGAYRLEGALLKQLRCERLQGEWFRGPLSDSVVAALQAEGAE